MAGKAEQNAKAAQLDQVVGGKAKTEAQADPAAVAAASAQRESHDAMASQLERLNVELRQAHEEAASAKADAQAEAQTVLIAGLLSRKIITEAMVDQPGFDAAIALFTELDNVTAERNALKRSLKAQKGATTKVKGAIEALTESLKPRALGPIEGQLTAAELAELLNGTDRVELAFSDGRGELAGVPPIAVPGSAFTYRRGRLSLEVGDVIVRGPADERGLRVLTGYALLIEGEQVAWIPRMAGQLTMGAGQQYSIKGDVVLA